MGNSLIQLAIIGCGRWGINHTRTASKVFKERLTHVCDLDERNREKVKEISPQIKFVTKTEEIFDNPEIQAVIIATPAETHYTLAKQCLEADKHLLVEKPMALFSDQARELYHLATGRKKILMVGHLLLYHPAIRRIKQFIQDGTIGKLQYIYSNRLNLGAVRKEENILWSFAPHDISVLQYLIEEDPIEIDAKGGIFLQPGIHDVTLTILRYSRNIHAHIYVSWLHPFKEHRLVVIGDKNMIVFEDSKKQDKLILYPKGIDWINGKPQKRDAEYQVIDYLQDEPLKLELEHFVQCVMTETQPLTDGKNGIKVLEILEQAQIRLENRETMKEEAPIPSQSGQKPRFFVHKTAIVDGGCDIGEGTKIWHFSHIQKGAVIGKGCTLGQNVNVANNVRIGNFVKIQNNVSVYEGVELEDYVFCGPSMVFTNVLNPRCEFPQRGSEHYHQTLVKYGTSIGANATIVCGNTIGRFAFIGAGAVITKDVPDYALVIGNPGRVVGWMCRCGTKLKFTENTARCSRCSRSYRKITDSVIGENDVEIGSAR
jgi:UDP-2-acetamido-3-amino-2,3-dideoxy-glucuronate N-acetyltransferase